MGHCLLRSSSLMDRQDFPYWILAFYSITPIDDPKGEVRRHKIFFKERDVACRIYISEQGINGQMSAKKEHALEYIDWLRSDERFSQLPIKIHGSHEQVFPKCAVRYRKQLVALDREVDMSKRGEPLSPKEWKKMLEKRDEQTVLIDVRNRYESAIGHFEGAEMPLCDTFRQFPEYAEELSRKRDPKKTRVMMYCTGGIRCEFYSALLKDQGFDEVYQLDGGVIEYGLSEGQAHWKGKLFVFDDRLAVPISNEPVEPISSCMYCNKPEDAYVNCANMDCNELFICCDACLAAYKGCCCEECISQERVRPINGSSRKPFRKWDRSEKQVGSQLSGCEQTALSH